MEKRAFQIGSEENFSKGVFLSPFQYQWKFPGVR